MLPGEVCADEHAKPQEDSTNGLQGETGGKTGPA